MTDEYRRFWITSSDGVEREWLLAEAFEAGAAGAQEIDEAGRYRASIYATSQRVASIQELLRRLSTEASNHHFLCVPAFKREFAGEHLESHDAHSINVTSRVERAASNLFRTHKLRSP